MTSKKKNSNKIFAALQTLGPSLTTGIAVIPLGGLLLGLSSILTNSTFISSMPFLSGSVIAAIAALFSNIGNLIINNLAVIFAVSVAMSYCRKDAVAAFSALLAFLAMHTTIGQILHITAESTADWTRYASVLGIPTLNIGVLGGILAGLVAAWVYNRFKDQKLPIAFSFFQGKRFVPIMAIIFGVITAVPVSIIWPLIQNLISTIANGASGADFSVWVMAGLSFLTFSLLPFGMHTFLYAAWAYQVGTYVSASGNVVHGLLNIFFAQLADGVPLTTTVPLTGNYILTGTLIGVALAIVKEAVSSKKEETKSLFMGGIVTNLFTGITEPLVFTYVFAAPILYWVAVGFMFLGELVVYFLNVTVGISFCGGLVDFLIYGVLQNASRWYLLPFISAAFGFLAYITARFLIRKFHLNVPGQEGFEDDAEEVTVSKGTPLAAAILEGLGGKENIADIDACATRLRVQVNDGTKVNKGVFKATGASGVVNVGTNYQIVYGTNAPIILEQIKSVIAGNTADLPAVVSEKDKKEVKFTESISAPASGELIPLPEVKDEMFAQGMMGTGFGIEPSDSGIYSPVNGKIMTIFPTKHAIGILSEDGKEILLHIGIDTVNLKGEPFRFFVKEGDSVTENQKLADVDFSAVEKAGLGKTVITVFTNIPDSEVKLEKQGMVKNGDRYIISFKK